MARPDIQIGERVFHPKQMGVLETVKANVLNGVHTLLTDALYPYQPQYQRVVDSMRLHIFYGEEATKAFDSVIDDVGRVNPQVKLAYELQNLAVPKWRINRVFRELGGGKISTQLIDRDRHEPYYRWYEAVDYSTHVLVPTL